MIILMSFDYIRIKFHTLKKKKIKIKHHFIGDYIQKEVLDIKFADIDRQWTNIFTKP